MRIEETISLCTIWSRSRNLIDGSSQKDQLCKLVEEVGELSSNITKGKTTIDDVGDCMIVLNNIALQGGYSLAQAMDYAYNQIKNRKGKTVNGIFIKER